MAEQQSVQPCLVRDYVFSMDAQGRVAVPSDWRVGPTPNSFVMIPGKGDTLQIYPPSTFDERIMPKLKALSPANPDHLRKLRQLGANIVRVECDKQGRIQLTAKQIAQAKLGKKVAFIGSGDFGQIMSAEAWEAEQAAATVTGDDFLDILG